VPGTNPFWFENDACRATGCSSCSRRCHDLEVYLLNTGRVGGSDDDEGSKKVKIPHSAAVREGHRRRRPSSGSRTPTSLLRGGDGIPGSTTRAAPAPPAVRTSGPRDEYQEIVERLKSDIAGRLVAAAAGAGHLVLVTEGAGVAVVADPLDVTTSDGRVWLVGGYDRVVLVLPVGAPTVVRPGMLEIRH
jgi:hypothetical protein